MIKWFNETLETNTVPTKTQLSNFLGTPGEDYFRGNPKSLNFYFLVIWWGKNTYKPWELVVLFWMISFTDSLPWDKSLFFTTTIWGFYFGAFFFPTTVSSRKSKRMRLPKSSNHGCETSIEQTSKIRLKNNSHSCHTHSIHVCYIYLHLP